MSGPKNTLGDLTNHLFAELERLGDEDLKGDALKEEIERARAVSDVAQQVISNANTMLRVVKVKAEHGIGCAAVPRELAGADRGITGGDR